MVVFQCFCANGHVFEGRFASEQAFAQQKSQGLVTCPSCDSSRLSILPSAAEPSVIDARPAWQELMRRQLGGSLGLMALSMKPGEQATVVTADAYAALMDEDGEPTDQPEPVCH